MKFKLEQYARYKATIELSGFEVIATSQMICAKFLEAGFIGVESHGTGKVREATGTWPNKTQEVELPAKIKSVTKI